MNLYICQAEAATMKQDPSTTSYYTEPQIYSFDAWGRRRNHTDWSDYNITSGFLFDRGFTGHEHLDAFELINMNGRVYDPIIARFLSPDPFIQAPDNTQSFNRYSYCFNNPLVYTDPSGEFIGTIWTAGIDLLKTISTKGGLEFWNWNGGNSYVAQAWKAFDPTALWSKTNKAWQIDMGWFRTDKDKPFVFQSWQIFSRFTYFEFALTLTGNIVGHYHNVLGNVESVENFYGATVLNLYEDRISAQAFTIGPYITGDINSTTISYRVNGDLTHESSLLIHEYGHYLEYRSWGTVGSLIGALNSAKYSPDEINPKSWCERDASLRGMQYFEKKGYGMQGFEWDEHLKRSKENLWWLRTIFKF